jgi:SOS response regulatory protein OraA/RecX
MSRVRRLAIVLLTMGVITAAVYGTGAFSTLTAQRNADIQVAGDAASYLSIKPSQGPNGEYADLRGGKLRVSVGSALDGKGNGVNKNAVTVVRDIFTITNQGSQSVGVWLTDSSNVVTFETGTKKKVLEGRKNAITLKPGTTLHVGLTVDTRGKTKDDLISSVTIHANSEVSGANIRTGSTKPASGGSRSTASPPVRTSPDGSSGPVGSNRLIKPSESGSTSSESKPMPSWTKSKSKNKNDDLSNLEKIGAFVSGGLAGNMGGSGGLLSSLVPDNYVKSPLYIFGQVLVSFVPGLNTAADVRSFLHNLITLNGAGIVVSGIALIPGLGSVGDVKQVLKNISKWVKKFPSSTDEALQLVAKNLLPHLPNKVSVKIMDAFKGGAATALRNKGVPADDIFKYQSKGYDLRKISYLRNHDISASAIRKYVDKGYSPRQIKLLLDHGFTAKGLRKLEPKNLDEIYKLRARGASADDILQLENQGVSVATVRKLMDEGFSLSRAKRLRHLGIPSDDILKYAEEGADVQKIAYLRKKEIPADIIRKQFDTGGDLGRLGRLKKQDVPMDDVRMYIDSGVDLRLVSKLRHQKISSDAIRNAVETAKPNRGSRYNRLTRKIWKSRAEPVERKLRRMSELKAQGLPEDHIEYYAKTGVNFRWVRGLRRVGKSYGTIKNAIQIGQVGQKLSLPANTLLDVRGWCKKRSENGTEVWICNQVDVV